MAFTKEIMNRIYPTYSPRCICPEGTQRGPVRGGDDLVLPGPWAAKECGALLGRDVRQLSSSAGLGRAGQPRAGRRMRPSLSARCPPEEEEGRAGLRIAAWGAGPGGLPAPRLGGFGREARPRSAAGAASPRPAAPGERGGRRGNPFAVAFV